MNTFSFLRKVLIVPFSLTVFASMGQTFNSIPDYEANFNFLNGAAMDQSSEWVLGNCKGLRIRGGTEVQFYHNDNVILQGGKLTLRAQERQGWGKDDEVNGYSWIDGAVGNFGYQPFQHTSGRVTTEQSFLYGRFEAECIIPKGDAYFPALWLMGCIDYSDGIDETDFGNEVDIFEFKKLNDVLNSESNQGLYSYHDWNVSPTYHCVYRDKVDNTVDFSQGTHVFRIDWTPEKVEWFVDNVKQRTVYAYEAGYPNHPMRISINLAIANNSYSQNLIQNTSFPGDFTINYLKVYNLHNNYSFPCLEKVWSNSIMGNPYDLTPSSTNIYLSGQLDTDQEDEFLSIDRNGGWSQVRNFDGKGFHYTNESGGWSNGGNGEIGTWDIGSGDRFIIGNFENGGSEELLCLNSTTNLAELEKFNGSGWSPDWNTVNGQIVNWIFNPTDHYLSGNFDVSHFGDELLCINPVPQLAWSQMEKYDGTDWAQEWSNSGSDAIGSWIINPQDKYVSGNFNKNTPEDEIFCINYATQWAKIMKYDGTNWNQEWSNGGNDKIGSSWYIGTNDQYVVGDFDNDGADEVLCINRDNNWLKILGYNGTTWVKEWSNSGNKRLNIWDFDYDTHVITGDFNGDSKDWIYAEGLREHDHVPGDLPINYPDRHYLHNTARFLLEVPVTTKTSPGTRRNSQGTSNGAKKSDHDGLIIFPNPGEGMFTLSFDDSLPENNVEGETLEVYNLMGQRVIQRTLTNESRKNSNDYTLDLRELPNGIYILKLRNQEVQRLVIEK